MPKQIKDQDVYEAALNAIVEHGYAGATTRLIAEAAGINEVTLFRKYGSKAELITAAIGHQIPAGDLETLPYSGDIEVDLTAIITLYRSTSQMHARLFPLIMSEISRYPELRQTMAGPMRFMQAAGQLLKRYQLEGYLVPEEPLHAVQGLLGPVIVSGMITRANPNLPVPPLNLPFHVSSFVKGRSP